MYNKPFAKGNINENYNKEEINKKYPISDIETFFNNIKDISSNLSKESYLEISHKYSNAYKIIHNEFKKGTFLSDDSFESLLLYNMSKSDGIEINVLNYNFNYETFSKLNFNEKFDLIFSMLGLTFEDLYNLLPHIIAFLKIDGIIALNIPAYWFLKEKQTDIEKTIIEYSKQNDKKWIFVEPLEPSIEKNGAELLEIKESTLLYRLDRLELAFISSLKKLYDAIIQNNKAHLEILKIPEKDIELRSATMIIKKKKKTLTKDNLFNL